MAKRRPSGDGMVRKREDGRWEGRIVVGHKKNGDSIFRYISAPTQKELSAKLRQLTEAYKGVDLTEESNMALSVWLDKWLDEYMAATLRPTTLNGYRRSLELHVKPYLGNKTLSKITAVDLRSLYRTLQETGRVHPRDGQSPGLSARTVHGIHTILHHALKTAMEQNLIPNNPAAEVDPPKFDGAPMKILTEAQLDAFMRVIEKDAFWHDFFYTAVTTGLRRGEILALQWDDLDLCTGVLRIERQVQRVRRELVISAPKTKSSCRSIILPAPILGVLRDYRQSIRSRWMFPSPKKEDSPLDPAAVRKKLAKVLNRADCKHIRFHDLRHTFATNALEHGMDIKTLSTIIGHVTSATTLNVYAHVTDTMRENAAASIDRGIAGIEPPRRASSPAKPKAAKTDFQPVKGKYRKPGTGCVSQIGEHLWEGRYSPKINGKRMARNVYAHTEAECEEKLANMIREMKAEIAAEKEWQKQAGLTG